MRLTPAFALALSGGGDSLALLHAAVDAGTPPALAIVVDHGVRLGSDRDAAWAAAQAKAMAVPAQVVRLAGVTPSQAGLRRARYAALAAAARDARLRFIAVAHTLDDQAETVLLRAARGSAWSGLAGMAPLSPLPLWPEGRNLYLVRPLLGVRRDALRRFLRRRGATWLDDPANAAPRYARTRARAWLARTGQAPRFAAVAEAIAPLAAARDRAAALCLAPARMSPSGVLTLPLKRLEAAPSTVRRRALAAAIAAAAGSDALPSEEALGPVLDVLAAGEGSVTLGGALIRVAGASATFGRDPGAVLGRRGGPPPLEPVPLAVGPLVWDGRFEIEGPAGALVAPLGRGLDPTQPALLQDGTATPAAAAGPARPLARERLAHALWRARAREASTFLPQADAAHGV